MPPDESAEDEIRRFEEQFRQQPESLVFARLADAHRKAGDPHRALAVLEEGIRRHTDYLSAHIVRARTYRDLGRVEDARSAFERVIEIDAQNLVAIQGLAEIARDANDAVAEISWLERLALADPQNPEPGERLELLRQQVDQEDSAGPRPDREGIQESDAEVETWWTEESASAAISGSAENPLADSDLASELWSGPAIVPGHDPAEGLESVPDGGVDSLEELADPFDDVEIEDAADTPSSAVEPVARDAWWFEPPPGQDAVKPGGEASDDDGSDDDADLLTRTMAELYARQGLIDEAEAIYRELLTDRPDDDGLRDGLDAVLGMRAARGASRAPDVPLEVRDAEVLDASSEFPEVEDIVEAESAAESTGPVTISAADTLTELLRAGEELVHRLPEPPSMPLAAPTDDSGQAGADSEDSEDSGAVDEQPDGPSVLEEWLRGLRT